jgi:hypothetical protein
MIKNNSSKETLSTVKLVGLVAYLGFVSPYLFTLWTLEKAINAVRFLITKICRVMKVTTDVAI